MEIVTLAFNRPDFIELQLNSIKKWVKDFNYTVYDNCPDDAIKDECERLGVKCIPIKLFSEDPSWCVGLSLNKMWETMQKMKGIVMYLDSDMFLINKLPNMRGYSFVFVPQYKKEYKYPWTGLMLFNMNTLPYKNELQWQIDYNIKDTDVGGLNHFYLEDHNPKVLELEMWTLIDSKKYSFNGKDTKKFHRNYAVMGLLGRSCDFPTPYSFDVLNVKDQPFKESFVFHFKSGSGYPEFMTDEYVRLKTIALKKLL